MSNEKPPYWTWKDMVRRCCDTSHKKYKYYGAQGVTVCEDWKTILAFSEWWEGNAIKGWQIDKDITGARIYSPETCFYVPRKINMFFQGVIHLPKIVRRGSKFRTVASFGRLKTLYSETQEDLLEQWYLLKDLYLEKLVWEMKEEHKKLCSEYPSTPQISPKLLSVLENFSTEEYLDRKNSLIV